MSNFDRLVETMARLRGEDGCPWDREQDHDTLKAYAIEETYELIEAIDKKDDEALKEELGDLLLQVVFHAQIAREGGRFDIDDVIEYHVDKLIGRHPHVFGDLKVNGVKEVISNWERIKGNERNKKRGKASVLEGVPPGLPALLKARRIQDKVSGVGFDWENVDGPLDKLAEEISELKEAYAHKERDKIEEELGDILFALVNVSRFLKVCPEEALRKTVDKFMERFKYIESELEKQGKDINKSTIEEMDALWEEAKKI